MKRLSVPSTYRQSDSEWSDCLPADWSEERVKDLFMLITDTAPPDHSYQLLSLFASIGVRPREEMEQRGNKAVTTDGYWIVKKGDIVVNKLLAWMGAIGLSAYEGVTSPAYDVIRKKNKSTDERYFDYLFRTEKSQKIFKRHSRGIMEVRLRLYFDKLGALTVPVPPFQEQQAIADYLDARTAQIDRKIELLTQKADKYRQLKQSIINETVTRGLDPSAPMKDSGVAWTHNMPAHWGLRRIRDLALLKSGSAITSDQIEDSGPYPVYGGNGVRGYFTNWTNEGDYVLIGRQGALCGNINFASGRFWASEHAVVAYLKEEANTRWFGELLRVMNLNQYSISAAQPGLSMERIGQLLIPVPPYLEQEEIARYIDSRSTYIDRVFRTIARQITKLQELRKALINDVVTGKLRVV